MPTPDTALAIPSKLTRVFAIESTPPVETRAENGSVVGELRVPIAISSDLPYRRWWGNEILGHDAGEIDTTYLDAIAPVLTDHENSIDAIRGRLENYRIEGGRLRADAVLDPENDDAVTLYGKIARGFVRFVSVGYSIQKMTLVEETETDRTYRVTQWTPMEASFVAVPADPSVGANREPEGTASVSVPITRATAPATPARSATMSDKLNAADVSAAPQGASREQELAELAQITGRSADLASWILSGRSVAEIRAEILTAQRAAQAPVTPAASDRAPEIGGVRERAEDKPWESPGEFFRAVVSAERSGLVSDVRLQAARAQNTLVGEEGGFVVPPAVSSVLLEATMTGSELLSRVTQRPVTVGNTFSETVVKEEARTNGSRNGGVRHYWIAEDGSYTESQAATRQVEGKLQKLGALVKLTEEQLQDGPQMESFLNEQVPEELRFGAELAIWEGDGVGKPLGAMSSGALISVAIEGSQSIANTAGNIWVNAAKMFSRMPARMLGGAAWFINQELWAKILTATAGTSGGSHPMFTPPGQLAGLPDGAIYGKPIIPVEYASAEGTVGDFVFANFSDYLFASKGTIRSQSSIHVDFVRDRTALKFTWRVNGQPRTRVPLTPLKGSNTLSPYIALAARS